MYILNIFTFWAEIFFKFGDLDIYMPILQYHMSFEEKTAFCFEVGSGDGPGWGRGQGQRGPVR